nr:MAG TPA: Fibronectin type III protein [Caudoviricetes sp.]
MTINLVNLGNGTYAIRIGDKFLVDYEGNLKCVNANVSGTVNATSGSFTGEINANSGKIGDCIIKDGKLEIKNANITDTIVAGAINLDTAAITGTLDAKNINVDSIKIKRGNISEKLTADEIDVNNLTVANAVNVTGTINANQINAGTLSADRINAGTLSWDKLIGFAPDTKISDSNNYLKSLHVTNLYSAIGYL